MMLIKFEDSWADEDEIRVCGFAVFKNPGAWDRILEEFKKQAYPYSFRIGTNQRITFENYKSLTCCFRAIILKQEEYQAIAYCFNEGIKSEVFTWGHFPFPEN
jgi:hypothetical protein